MSARYRIILAHGDQNMRFGLLQNTEDGSLRASSPCCGVLMEESDGECNFCGQSWEWLADRREANNVSEFAFESDDDGWMMNDVVETWIQRLLGFEEHSSDCKIKVDWK